MNKYLKANFFLLPCIKDASPLVRTFFNQILATKQSKEDFNEVTVAASS